MSDALVVALIAGPLSGAVTILLTKAMGRRRDAAEVDASVAAAWQAWSHEQGQRIMRLEERVGQLETDLSTAREQNRRQASLLTAVIQWALQLRDEIIRLNGHPPPAPPEVQAALTSLDPPA